HQVGQTRVLGSVFTTVPIVDDCAVGIVNKACSWRTSSNMDAELIRPKSNRLLKWRMVFLYKFLATISLPRSLRNNLHAGAIWQSPTILNTKRNKNKVSFPEFYRQ